jgi:hypothetical protein
MMMVEAYAQEGMVSHDKVVAKIKDLLDENYILQKNIKRISDSLAACSYSDMSHQEFADRINSVLIKSSKDKHLHLEYNPSYAQKMLGHSDANEGQRSEEKITNFGFEKLEILPGNIGILKLAYFADPTDLDELIKSAYTFFKNTDNLIIDLRGNSGGSGAMLQKLVSGFLPVDASTILRIEYRNDTIHLKVDSTPLFRYENPLYLLCDGKTFSAGEGFALVLQNRRRATVIGETTAGAGNIAGPYVVDKDFVLTIPVGVVLDPLTGNGWESGGVTPDITASAGSALEKAIEKIRHK